jgi:hypothetical protein
LKRTHEAELASQTPPQRNQLAKVIVDLATMDEDERAALIARSKKPRAAESAV